MLYYAPYHLLQLRRGAKETAARNLDSLTNFHKRQMLPKLRLCRNLLRILVPPQTTILSPGKQKHPGCRHILMPEKSLHSLSHFNLSALVVNCRIRQIRIESNAALIHLAAYAAAQLSGVDERTSLATRRAYSPLPRPGEKGLPLKVSIKLRGSLNPYIVEYLTY